MTETIYVGNGKKHHTFEGSIELDISEDQVSLLQQNIVEPLS